MGRWSAGRLWSAAEFACELLECGVEAPADGRDGGREGEFDFFEGHLFDDPEADEESLVAVEGGDGAGDCFAGSGVGVRRIAGGRGAVEVAGEAVEVGAFCDLAADVVGAPSYGDCTGEGGDGVW